MATASRHAEPGVDRQLRSEPWRFSFLQATRLLRQIASQPGRPANELGTDVHPDDEFVQLTSVPSRAYPGAEVLQLLPLREPGAEPASDGAAGPGFQMVTGFMGLYGPMGVLPMHDTQRIINGIARSGERKGKTGSPEKDFLDLLNHRFLSMFYRASVKYRVSIACEQTFRNRHGDGEDVFTRSLHSLAGFGTAGLRHRQAFDEGLLLEFSGLWAHFPRNAVSLRNLLEASFRVPVQIRQFVGQWLELDSSSCSLMPTRSNPEGQNCQLGRNYIMGSRVWDVQGKFEVLLGPLGFSAFEEFAPGTRRLLALAQLIRTWCNIQFDFDIRLELLAAEVPACGLAGASRLGQNSWLISRPPAENKRDAVLRLDGFPVAAG